jgi:hypothetical protein
MPLHTRIFANLNSASVLLVQRGVLYPDGVTATDNWEEMELGIRYLHLATFALALEESELNRLEGSSTQNTVDRKYKVSFHKPTDVTEIQVQLSLGLVASMLDGTALEAFTILCGVAP